MSQNPTDYKIISTLSRWGMARQARKLMSEGWQLTGGINQSWGILYQAFIK